MIAQELQLVLVREGPSAGDRRALARDAQRGLLVRVRSGVYVEREGWAALSPEGQHVVAMRALAAVAQEPPIFSHWSAAVLRGLPAIRRDLRRVHVSVATPFGRSLVGVAAHVASVSREEIAVVDGLLSTTPARTIVDIALTASFEDGVMAADAALRAGLHRGALYDAVAAAATRRGARRAQTVAAFARPGAESAAESRSRVTMVRLGVPPPVLQFEVIDRAGLAGRLDFWFPQERAGGEVDGDKKYLELDKEGAGRAVVREKRREDRIRRSVDGLARWGWPESGNAALLGPILAAAGIHPASSRAGLAEYCTPFLSASLG